MAINAYIRIEERCKVFGLCLLQNHDQIKPQVSRKILQRVNSMKYKAQKHRQN